MASAPAPSSASATDLGRERRLRVALVYDCLYPQTIGGIEHRNAQLAHALAARGHSVTLAGMGAGPPSTAGIDVISLGPRSSDGSSRTALDSARFALAMTRLPFHRFDVVEAANIPFAHLFPLALLCRVRRVPLLVTWHEVWGDYWARFTGSAAWRILAGMEVVAAQLGDAVNAVSELTAGRLAALRSGECVPVVPNGLPFQEVALCARDAPTGPPLVTAGRLLAHKRIDLLLDAVALLPRTGPLLLLRVIGDGPERRRLEDRARTLGVADRVHFSGRLADERAVWRALGGAAVAVQPSAREGFGIFPLEAMAAGLPVVYCEAPASAVGELVRDGREGLRARAEPAALAQALATLLADNALRARLADGARRRAQEYDWEAVATRFEALLAALVRGS